MLQYVVAEIVLIRGNLGIRPGVCLMRSPFDTTCDIYRGPASASPGSFVGTFDCKLVVEDAIETIGVGAPTVPAYLTIADYEPVGAWTFPAFGIDADLGDRVFVPSGSADEYAVLLTDLIAWHGQTPYYRAYLMFPVPTPIFAGGVEVGGDANTFHSHDVVGSGGVLLGGSGLRAYLTGGGVLLGGSGLRAYLTGGGVLLGGSGLRADLPGGGVLLGGNATITTDPWTHRFDFTTGAHGWAAGFYGTYSSGVGFIASEAFASAWYNGIQVELTSPSTYTLTSFKAHYSVVNGQNTFSSNQWYDYHTNSGVGNRFDQQVIGSDGTYTVGGAVTSTSIPDLIGWAATVGNASGHPSPLGSMTLDWIEIEGSGTQPTWA